MNPTLPLLKSLAEPKEAPPIKWTIDCPTRGVVFLDVAVVQDASTVPLHWRAGNWTKPPLDLRLNEMGGLESIQFAFQDESVDSGQSSLPDVSEVGLPTFDVHGWPADRYMDVRILVETVRLPSGELYTAIGDAQPERSVFVTEGLRLGFDSSDRLAAVVVGPLTADEWQVVAAAAPLK